jgi:two-component system sensor histidine kinase DesK
MPVVTRSGVSAPEGRRWPGVLRYLAMFAAAMGATLVVGQSATATWVFLAVSGMWTFGGWLPYVLAAGLAGGYELLAYRLDSWERDNSLSFAIAFAVIAVTSAMVAIRRSRDLEAAQRENARLAVEEERNRVARDLHDILGHSLTVIRVKAELAARMVDLDPARARAEAEAVESLAREALADVRGAVEGFREISLAAEIARAREALESAGIAADLPRRVDTVDPALRELYAWTVREGVTNVIRHSGARTCSVAIDERGLRLADDGTVAGPGPAGRSQGHGLTGLAERARLAGASLSARRLEPRGFELVVSSAPATGGPA